MRGHEKNDLTLMTIREALAMMGYVDPLTGKGIRILSMDGGGTRFEFHHFALNLIWV